MADSEYWVNPEVMARLDAEMSAKPAQGLADKGDFGSYAVANRGGGLAGSGIEAHNLLQVDGRAALYDAILPKRRWGAIADMGCGLGLTTDAVRRRLGAQSADGYEISSDAVAFASRTFPQSRFHRFGITPDSRFDRRFDLVLCQELYAFTRISDWGFQHAMVVNFMDHLLPGGVLLIELSERDADRTVLANLDKLERICAVQGWSYRREKLPYDRIWRMVPVLPPARLLSCALTRLRGSDPNVALVIQK